MYDIDIKNVKKAKKFNWIFIGVGIVFLVIMLAIFFSSVFMKNTLDSVTQSTYTNPNHHTDSDGDMVYSPIFTYEVDGKEYTCTSRSSSSIGPGDESHKIYYDSKDPSKCMSDYSEKIDWLILIFAFLPAIFIVIGACMNHNVSKRVKQIEELNQHGKLVKNLPYHLEQSNFEINDSPVMKVVVDYRLPTGETVKLEGDPRFDRKESDEDGKVDLVIDEQNPKNYFLDFEINRIGGNHSSDYYVNPNASTDEQATQSQPEPQPEPTPTQSSEPTIPPAIKI